MELSFLNCNNIDSATIEIKENKLNIKFGINGTGKSTIAKAIQCVLEDRGNTQKTLPSLVPFKCIKEGKKIPSVLGFETIQAIRVFDEKYINEFVYQPDELVKGSFDIFIRDAAYDKGMEEINELVAELQKLFSEDTGLTDLIRDFGEISDSFGKPTKNGIHASSSLAKAFKEGNKVTNIPAGLEGYKVFIQSEENYKWVKWQLDGKDYMEMSDNCAYCTNDLQAKRPMIRKVSESYASKAVESLNKIVAVFQRLDKYFSEETRLVIRSFIGNDSGYSNDQVAVLGEVKSQIDRLNEKFVRAQRLGFSSLKDVDKIIDALRDYKIDLSLFNHLQSDATKDKVDVLNGHIDSLLDKAGILQGKIAQQNSRINKLVEENKRSINEFMRNAGYRYEVDLTPDSEGQHRLKLVHLDIEGEVSDVKDKLSFGERNAFALVMFMHDTLKVNPDLIVLDDPISSFDKNKKYAIIELLFHKTQSFKDKTVLLLTHDMEPIIDMVYHHCDRFSKPVATFLNNTNGELSEIIIEKSDISTFVEINRRNIIEATGLSRLIYLRRNYEALNEKDLPYHLVSSLLHRKSPTVKIQGVERAMTEQEQQDAAQVIREKIPDFDIAQAQAAIQDDDNLRNLYKTTDSNYEKLHFFRMLTRNDGVDSNIIKKFINEAFHFENDYIYQLNPRKYQTVPGYVIAECDRIIELEDRGATSN